MPPRFVPGIELSRAFYAEAVAALIGDVEHAAALLGWGSDVLGFDTLRSTDHGWGPRVHVFVEAADTAVVSRTIEDGLPDEFRGWPTRFGWDDVPVSHHVDVGTLSDWLNEQLGFDPRAGVATRQWLTTPQQRLLEITGGAVYHDPHGELAAVRGALAWYPDEVWLWLLACQWRRIDQEEAFVGRAAEVEDQLGSRVLAARLVRDAMRLGFLLERRYAPYGKWLGTAFAQLEGADTLHAAMLGALAAVDATAREDALVAAMEELAARHNALGLTRAVDPSARLFFSRPFRVVGSARFVDACLERVTDPWLRSLPLVGAIDQFADSTDVLSDQRVFCAFAAVLDGLAAPP